MNNFLANKNILLGITGGIAAYKSADLTRRLCEAGANVRVVMTQHAKEFITPLTLQALSGNPVHSELFDLQAEAAMGHIELARWADVIVVAPATANFMARLLSGNADELLTTLCLAAKTPVVLAPAMNQGMWKNTATQENLQALKTKGIHFFGPTEGSQACGDFGLGRMLEPLEIIERLSQLFATGNLAGKTVVITAGPTQEHIDPVRYISNASSGKMGYALAEAAVEAGAHVTLISGPVHLASPRGLKLINVVTTQEMLNAVMNEIPECDIFLSVAAVADYRCKNSSNQKIKKTEENIILELTRNPDIVATVTQHPSHPYVVGFAAETDSLIEHARAKLKNKNLNMVIANQANDAIGSDENRVSVLWGDEQLDFPKMSKYKLARELISLIAKRYAVK